MSGFGAHHETECQTGSIPRGQFTPQKCANSLFAEKISGTAFTVPRKFNLQCWLYRKLPSVVALGPIGDIADSRLSKALNNTTYRPQQLRWRRPHKIFKNSGSDFLRGLHPICGAGTPHAKKGLAIYLYGFNESMNRSSIVNCDGDFLIVPQAGNLNVVTELGRLHVRVGEIVVIPRGIKYHINGINGECSGYVLEVFDGHFDIPDRGPIGANGLANERDFLAPVAWMDDTDGEWEVWYKFNHTLHRQLLPSSPYNVAGWVGNYYPYKYDLDRFNTIGSVSFDHPDPSIFTCLTCPSATPGVALADFVIFPPRWLVAENTFQPAYFHRNVMAEFMGLIRGEYDAKDGSDFLPGSALLHNTMIPHGPDAVSFKKAIQNNLRPHIVGEGSMAFMFESMFSLGATNIFDKYLDCEYFRCWHFSVE